MKNKKNILIIGSIIFILILAIILYININDDTNKEEPIIEEPLNLNFRLDMENTDNAVIKEDIKYNISEEIKKVHEYKQVKFDDMKISCHTNHCYLEFTFTNLAIKEEVKNYTIFIDYLDKKGKVYESIAYFIPKLKIGESYKDKLELPYDIGNAYDYQISGFIEDYEVK